MATVGSAIVCDRLRLYGNRTLCDRLRSTIRDRLRSAIVCDRLRSYGNQPLVIDRLYKRLFLIALQRHHSKSSVWFLFLSLAIGHNRRRIGSIRSTRSADFSYPLETLFCRCVCFLSLSPSDFRLVGSVFVKTDRVHPCPHPIHPN